MYPYDHDVHAVQRSRLEALTPLGKYFADSIYLIALATYLYAIFMLIRPMLVRRPSTAQEREAARSIIIANGKTILAPFALLPDKSYFFTKGGSVLDYVLEGRYALVLGYPISLVARSLVRDQQFPRPLFRFRLASRFH